MKDALTPVDKALDINTDPATTITTLSAERDMLLGYLDNLYNHAHSTEPAGTIEHPAGQWANRHRTTRKALLKLSEVRDRVARLEVAARILIHDHDGEPLGLMPEHHANNREALRAALDLYYALRNADQTLTLPELPDER